MRLTQTLIRWRLIEIFGVTEVMEEEEDTKKKEPSSTISLHGISPFIYFLILNYHTDIG